MNDKEKIAFLFLTLEGSDCYFIWDDFFKNADKNLYRIFCHPKYPEKVNDFLKDYIIAERIPTKWGEPSLVRATFLLLKYAFEDPSISHFILLSHNTAPLVCFDAIYNEITKNTKKGYIKVIDNREDRQPYHSQWAIFPRIFVEKSLSSQYLLFLLLKLYSMNNENQGKIPCIFDEQWIEFLVNRIYKQQYEDFFSDIRNNKTYQQLVCFKDVPNQNLYKDYSRKQYKNAMDWAYNADRKRWLPYIYSIKEFFDIKNNIVKEGYFFIRKIYGTKKEYDSLKKNLGLNDIFK